MGAYDTETRDFYVLFRDEVQTLRWNGEALVPAGPLPTVGRDGAAELSERAVPRAILTLAEAGGTFAVGINWRNEDERNLWFRPFDGNWTLIADNTDLERFAPRSRFPGPFGDADVSEDGSFVRLFAGHNRQSTVLLRRGPSGWVLEGALPLNS
ncbi:hypothetical protein V8J82_23660, partial [Gymnodinialimonas sp. 2305UL16-5]|uniref:hypothetical protein n=1 Tax=Gymnodinialimonas mytili TaxID=3126503 RepID=UPI0030A51600